MEGLAMPTSWNRTAVSDLLGIEYPIIQGPFGGGLSSIELVAAVSNAGGLGGFGAHHLDPDAIVGLVHEVRGLTDKPFAINLWVSNEDDGGLDPSRDEFARHAERLRPFYEDLGLQMPVYPERIGYRFDDQIEALLEVAPPAFSWVYGVPAPRILEACRARGIRTIGTATTPDEAAALEEAGAEMVVASGADAGGHRTSFLRSAEDSLCGTFSLIPQIVDRVRVPVIAAGGIADARGIAAALALGAEAAQVGTAFLACDESNATLPHRAKLLAGEASPTRLTRAFSGRLARGMINVLMTSLEESGARLAPYPLQGWLTAQLKSAALEQGREDLLVMWSGQAAPLVRHRNVADLMRSLTDGSARYFADLAVR